MTLLHLHPIVAIFWYLTTDIKLDLPIIEGIKIKDHNETELLAKILIQKTQLLLYLSKLQLQFSYYKFKIKSHTFAVNANAYARLSKQ